MESRKPGGKSVTTAEDRDLLVLDDDAAIMRALRRTLGAHYAVRCAASADEARALMSARVPTVLLSDFELAEGTAATFLREVKARWPEVRCVLHSAACAEDWNDLLDDGVLEAVVGKPATAAEILAQLESQRR
jgi:DNA-binding NtrC family response regulator